MVCFICMPIVIIFKSVLFVLVYAHEDKLIKNTPQGFLGCQLACYRHGSCSELRYYAVRLTCRFVVVPSPIGNTDNLKKHLSEFPCSCNNCRGHEKCLTTRKGRKTCIDIRRKSSAKTKVTSNIKRERSLIWTTTHEECVADVKTKQRDCIRYKGHSALDMDSDTGDMFYGEIGTTNLHRKKVLSKKIDFEGKGYSEHFHILKDQKCVFVDANSSVHVTTTTFQQQPCNFNFGYPFGTKFWTSVDEENRVLFYATKDNDYFKFYTLDMKTCRTCRKPFYLLLQNFTNFVIHDENMFFCLTKGIYKVDLKTRTYKSITKGYRCERIVMFHGNIFIVNPGYRVLKKFDTRGKFLMNIQVHLWKRDDQEVKFVHFTPLSFRELYQRKHS